MTQLVADKFPIGSQLYPELVENLHVLYNTWNWIHIFIPCQSDENLSKMTLEYPNLNKYFWHFSWLPYLYIFSLYGNASFIVVSAETEYISTRSWYRNINFPNMCNNIPASPVYGVCISQLIRYTRASSNYSDFLKRHLHLRNRLLD
jgi:hypothetical protein